MKTKVLNTMMLDGMYMDIHSIEFKIDEQELNKTIQKCRSILKENEFLNSVTVGLFNFKPLQAIKYFNSTEDDEEKTEDTDSRIDTELLIVGKYGGVFYRGYSKWSSDFLEVEI